MYYENLWKNGMDNEHKVLCSECKLLRPYYICIEPTKIKQLDDKITYDKRVAYCRHCNERIFVPGLDDLNGMILDNTIIEYKLKANKNENKSE